MPKQVKSVDGFKTSSKSAAPKKTAAKKTTTTKPAGVKVTVRRSFKPAVAPTPLKEDVAIRENVAPIQSADEPAPAVAPEELPTEGDAIIDEINRLEESDPDMTNTDDIREMPKDKKLGKKFLSQKLEV